MRLLNFLVAGTLVLLITFPSIIAHQYSYLLNSKEDARKREFLIKYRQAQFRRQLKEDSPPSAKDDPLVQPDGGNRRGTGVGNHHSMDLQEWEKQHPKSPP